MAEMRRNAIEAFSDGKFELAAQLFKEAIDAGPASADLYAGRAQALGRFGDYIGALAEINKALDMDPTIQRAYLMKGILCMKLKDYHCAQNVLRLGSSYGPADPKFIYLLKKCEQHIHEENEEILEAFSEGNYDLALELCNDAIAVSPNASHLYIDRAAIHIKLRNYKEAVADSTKATELNPVRVLPYIQKGFCCMVLRDYRNAVTAVKLGLIYEPNNQHLELILKKCEGEIDGKEALGKEDANVRSTLSTIKRKYKHVFYNSSSTQVVLSISAKSVAANNVRVEFGKQELNVSIMTPGEEDYQFQCELNAEIIPENCKFKVLPNEVEIRLAKADPQYWTCLSQNSISTPKDYEFSWSEERLNQKYIVPQVRNQGKRGTCMFHAVTCTAEMEVRKHAANQKPPESSKLKFSANDFAADYEKAEGPLNIAGGLKFFKEKGVLAQGKGVERIKYKIKNYQSRKLRFREIQKLIKQGRPVVGALYANEDFGNLGPNDIYDPDPMKTKGEGHAVVYIGYGWRAGRAYLVFLNSYGSEFGSSGIGRVYFDHAYSLYTIDVF